MIRVKAAVFSVTPVAPADDDGSYLRWHLLDHGPEQYQLPGVALALRWIADGAYIDQRIVATGHLADLGNVMHYLMGDPLQQTFDDFLELGPRLRDVGRFPVWRPSLDRRLLALLKWYASPRVLVSPEVIPWRPHRGVLLVVEQPATDNVDAWLQWLHSDHYPALLQAPGVAGVWMYGSTDTWRLPKGWQGAPQYNTVVYLDDDPLATSKALTPLIEQRWASGAVKPVFAGPMRTMTTWEAWT